MYMLRDDVDSRVFQARRVFAQDDEAFYGEGAGLGPVSIRKAMDFAAHPGRP